MHARPREDIELQDGKYRLMNTFREWPASTNAAPPVIRLRNP